MYRENQLGIQSSDPMIELKKAIKASKASDRAFTLSMLLFCYPVTTPYSYTLTMVYS